MKKMKIRHGYVRVEGAYYCLTDLYKVSGQAKHSLSPWDWAKQEGETRSISRRGWIFRTQWARLPTLFAYADYLSLEDELREELNLPRPFISYEAQVTQQVNAIMAENAKKLAKTRRSSVTHHRSGRSSISHHRSEPDPITTTMAYSHFTDDYQSSGSDSCSSDSGGGGCGD